MSVVGRDFSGEIVDTGTDVKDFALGDEVSFILVPVIIIILIHNTDEGRIPYLHFPDLSFPKNY